MATFYIPKKRFRLTEKDILGYIFVAPAVLLFMLFTLTPIVLVFVLSFTNYNGITLDTANFVWIKNYAYIFKTNSDFWDGMVKIIIYTAVTVPLTIFMSLLLAVIVEKKLPMTKFFRGLFYIPGITSVIASATVWRYLLSGDGVINGAISSFNELFHTSVKPILTTNKSTALWGPVLMALWGNLGGNMVLFLAAFGNISDSILEAAKVDGARPKRVFFQIKIPLILPAINFAFTLALIGAPQMFEPILALDANMTSPVYEIYKNAVKETAAGLGAAQSVLLFGIIMVVTFVTQRFSKESLI